MENLLTAHQVYIDNANTLIDDIQERIKQNKIVYKIVLDQIEKDDKALKIQQEQLNILRQEVAAGKL